MSCDVTPQSVSHQARQRMTAKKSIAEPSLPSPSRRRGSKITSPASTRSHGEHIDLGSLPSPSRRRGRIVSMSPASRQVEQRYSTPVHFEKQQRADIDSVLNVPRLSGFTYIFRNDCPSDAATHSCGSPWLLPSSTGANKPVYTTDGRLHCNASAGRALRAFVEQGPERVVRAGPKPGLLEVFEVDDEVGLGVRTRLPMAPWEFVCEYAGEVLSDSEVEARCCVPGRDAYLFDLTTVDHWRTLGAQPTGSKREFFKAGEPAFVIDAFAKGNVGRFLNHACGPAWQANVTPVFIFTEDVPGEALDARLPRVAFFTNRAVAAGEELRYDYDMQPGDVDDMDGNARCLLCCCGSILCRGRIY